ncbi:MAG: AAA family ATPase [Gemmatimonadota bacterium]
MSAGRRARFRSIELAFGAHRRSFDFPGGARPVVIAGPNGSGKTTLLEGLVRTLYGFYLRSAAERQRHGLRRPWEGDGFRASVTLETEGGELLVVTRDFDTDEVTVRPGEGGAPIFQGEAKPGLHRESHRRYRELLESRFGLGELESYEQTACVRQGSLADTRLGDHLLRIAAGGHAAVDAAREAIREAHYRLTRESIGPGQAGKRSDQEREQLQAAVRELEAKLAAARDARERRRPLVEEERATRLGVEQLDTEIRALEAALGPLNERRALRERAESARTRLERAEELLEELEAALRGLEEAEAEAAGAAAGEAPYPEDFEERAGALLVLWRDRERLGVELASVTREAEERRPAGSAVGVAAGGFGVAAGIAAAVWWSPSIGSVLATAGLLGTLAAVLSWARARAARRAATERRSELEADLADVTAAIETRLRGVPEAETLTPATFPDRRRVFRRQKAARHERERRRAQLTEAVARAHGAVRTFRQRRGVPAAVEEGGEDLAQEARRLRALLAEERRRVTEELATLNLRMETSAPGDLGLPGGVEPAAGSVEAALAERRPERERLASRLSGLEVKLATEGKPTESPVALERRLGELRARLEEVEREVRAHRDAYRLLDDAYEEFRAGDQERLLGCISSHLGELGGGELGPLEATDGLDAARLRAFGRVIPLTSPPLSFGELHAVLFAIRLGAVDFLAGAGIHLPLLVDEPFAHLDPRRAAELWRLLCRVARDRQVLVATQDTLVLERLAVEPDIMLPEPVQREFDFAPP